MKKTKTSIILVLNDDEQHLYRCIREHTQNRENKIENKDLNSEETDNQIKGKRLKLKYNEHEFTGRTVINIYNIPFAILYRTHGKKTKP